MPSSADQPQPAHGNTPQDDLTRTPREPVEEQDAPRRTAAGPLLFGVGILFAVAMGALMVVAFVRAL